ncbi:hypothetical protein MHYP_G00120500 [Metynnis hypsauchen]
MVLEEVDSDWERQQMAQRDAEAKKQEDPQGVQSSPLLEALPRVLPEVLAMDQEDAETQTEGWTPLVENIKRKAEEAAMVSMQERLEQERLEAARMAEELALQAAELAVRQLEEEHTGLINMEPELSEPDNGEQLQPLHEESEEESGDSQNAEYLVDVCPADELEAHETEDTVDSPPRAESPEPPKIAEPEPARGEPARAKRTSLPVVTTQPQPAASDHSPQAGVQEEETQGDGCGVPSNCSTVKSWILRIPHASHCFSSFNQLLKRGNLTSPKLPSLPPDLLLLYQEFAQLPKQAQQRCQNIYLHLNSLKPQ